MRLLKALCLAVIVVPLLIAFWIVLAILSYQHEMDKAARGDRYENTDK
jgi:hypothetical protein